MKSSFYSHFLCFVDDISANGIRVARGGEIDKGKFVTHQTPRASWVGCWHLTHSTGRGLHFVLSELNDAHGETPGRELTFFSCRCPHRARVSAHGGIQGKYLTQLTGMPVSWFSVLFNIFLKTRSETLLYKQSIFYSACFTN
jgi:hypothetical protein